MTVKAENKIQVVKVPTVAPSHAVLVDKTKNIYKAKNCVNLSAEEKKDEKIQNALKLFYETVTVEAKSTLDASKKLSEELAKVFIKKVDNSKQISEALKKVQEQAEAKKKADEQKATSKQADKKDSTKTPAKEKSAEKPKEETKREEPVIAEFKYFEEYSSCKCYALTDKKEETVKTAVEFFALEHKNRILEQDLTPEQEKFMNLENTRKSIQSVLNSSIYILITEHNEKKELVNQFLLKPLYFSVYAILSVAVAHNKPNKIKSIYHDLVNTDEHEMYCAEAFHFNPLVPHYSRFAPNTKTKHTTTFQFVTVKTSDRK